MFSPPGYSVRLTSAVKGFVVLGKLVEYQDIKKDNKSVSLNGDAIIVGDKTIYFAVPIFEYIGGVLQGHVCIEPLRNQLGDGM